MPRRPMLMPGVLLALAACGTLTGPANQTFADAKARWTSQGSASYDYLVTRFCFCAWQNRTVAVSVRNGQVAAATYVDTGAAVEASLRSSVPTVPDLFDLIEQARAARAAVLSTAYDAVYGYPVRIQVDPSATVADDEWSISTQNLALVSTLQQRP